MTTLFTPNRDSHSDGVIRSEIAETFHPSHVALSFGPHPTFPFPPAAQDIACLSIFLPTDVEPSQGATDELVTELTHLHPVVAHLGGNRLDIFIDTASGRPSMIDQPTGYIKVRTSELLYVARAVTPQAMAAVMQPIMSETGPYDASTLAMIHRALHVALTDREPYRPHHPRHSDADNPHFLAACPDLDLHTMLNVLDVMTRPHLSTGNSSQPRAIIYELQPILDRLTDPPTYLPSDVRSEMQLAGGLITDSSTPFNEILSTARAIVDPHHARSIF